MTTPDVGKHLRDLSGGLILELAAAKARIEQLEAELKTAKEQRTGDAPV